MGPQEDTTGVCVNYRGTTEMHGSPEKTPAVNSSVNKKKKSPTLHGSSRSTPMLCVGLGDTKKNAVLVLRGTPVVGGSLAELTGRGASPQKKRRRRSGVPSRRTPALTDLNGRFIQKQKGWLGSRVCV